MTSLTEENKKLRAAILRIDKLEAAVKNLQATATQQPQVRQPQVEQSYAEKVKKVIEKAGTDTRRQQSSTVLIAAPEGADIAPEQLKGAVLEVVNPRDEGWQVVRHRITRSTKIAIEAPTPEQARIIADNGKLKAAGYKTEIMGRRNPRMVIYDIPAAMTPEEVQDAIIQQNFHPNTTREELGNLREQLAPKFKVGK